MSVGRDDCPRVRLPSLPRGLELFFFFFPFYRFEAKASIRLVRPWTASSPCRSRSAGKGEGTFCLCPPGLLRHHRLHWPLWLPKEREGGAFVRNMLRSARCFQTQIVTEVLCFQRLSPYI